MLGRNQILKERSTDKRWRVLAVNKNQDSVWLFEMDNPNAMPVTRPIEMFDDEKAFEVVPPPAITTNLHVSPAEKARREQARDVIKPLVEAEGIFDPSQRSALVQARAQETQTSRPTIYYYLRTWWRNGQNVLGLTPGFKKIGRCKGTMRRGRKPQYTEGTFQLKEEDREYMATILQTEFLSKSKNYLTDAYQALLQAHYSYIDAEGRRILYSPGERPSLRQFRYHASKSMTAELMIRKRKGDAEFALKHRAVLGSVRQATYTAGERYEIDSTIMDFHLVHREDPSKIIGKPTAYLIVDTKTSLIVGWYIGVEPPCWLAAQQAILSITQDKEAQCARLRIPYDERDWPAVGVLPRKFVADRGAEMLSEASSQLNDLGIEVVNLPSRRADRKPHVELAFRQLQRHMLRATIPGYTPPEEFGKRQTVDHSQFAALTLEQMERAIVLAIIALNRMPKPEYPLTPEQILRGVEATPLNLWNVEIQERAGLLEKFTEQQVRFALLPRVQAHVSREGIRVGDCYYTSEEAQRYGWFSSKAGIGFTRTVSYDPRSVDRVYVHDAQSPQGYFVAALTPASQRYAGYSFQEMDDLVKRQRQLAASARERRLQIKADYAQDTQPMVQRAEHETALATKGKRRGSRKKDTVVAREDTRHQERQAALANDALAPQLSLPGPQPANVTPLHPVADPAKKIPNKYQAMLDGE
jgi:hypothetical protein